MTRIAIFASGSGSNTENIIRYFSDNKDVKVVLVLSNQSRSGVLIRAQLHNIPTFIFTKDDLNECSKVHDMLKDYNASMIVLAGFLLKIPLYMIEAYPNSILNIHPALLPKYGGKGMYGMNVHTAVVENKDEKTGITIHYVNENYDEGAIIFQATCDIDEHDLPEDVKTKVQALELCHFPSVIESIIP
jgi:phosphoribosylglycinamide formyltransferase 1